MERKSAMEQDMTKGSPFRVLIMFTLPLAIGNIFQQLYNMADTIIVGRYVGADALAAVGSTGTVMFLLNGFAQGITAGFAVLTSQRYGAKKMDGVRQSVSNGILLSLIGAIGFTAASLLFMRPLLHLMNTPENIFAQAYEYISLISLGMVANVFYNLFSSYLRAVGNSRMPLVFLVLSACLNVVLDLILIINFKMGVAGAAWATNLSQAISAVLCAVYIYKKVPALMPEKRHWRFHKGDTRYQLATGIPMALQFAITSSGTMVMQSAINLFGSEAVAAYTAAGKIQYGKEVKQYFTPVFWNTSWFKMRPPHTTGIFLNEYHPLFREFPTEYHSNLQWWELLNKAQVMQFTGFPTEFQPTIQSIDTWFINRKIGMLFEANVLNGKLIMTSMDITSKPEKRVVARQMHKAILDYMNSDAFRPTANIAPELIQELFTKVAGDVKSYTKDSPDELKPKIN